MPHVGAGGRGGTSSSVLACFISGGPNPNPLLGCEMLCPCPCVCACAWVCTEGEEEDEENEDEEEDE